MNTTIINQVGEAGGVKARYPALNSLNHYKLINNTCHPGLEGFYDVEDLMEIFIFILETISL